MVDRKLYIDGGSVNWAPLTASPANEISEYPYDCCNKTILLSAARSLAQSVRLGHTAPRSPKPDRAREDCNGLFSQ